MTFKAIITQQMIAKKTQIIDIAVRMCLGSEYNTQPKPVNAAIKIDNNW